MPSNDDYRGLGRLKISAIALDTHIPCSGAVFRVHSPNDMDTVLDEVTADISGQTEEISLPCPIRELSEEPDSKYRPYAEYTVSVSIDGYAPKVVEGVQILADTSSYQDIGMLPSIDSNVQNDFTSIEDNALWGNYPPKTPEDAVKELPKSGGFVVLPKPVIPEFVVVHNGTPTTAGQNYRVTFKEYIKNVACTEIYATWPTQTIKANVLAILSFTLNRVYTEWYRGKGYDFTITNSTAYDQAYSHGRNIFDSISQVVDEIFTHYITKPQIEQPYFTQYCDGKNVSCPKWMTQWGSKELGDKGYMALDILKHYYGSDIYLTEAERVEGIPSSYPGTPLKLGSTGEGVRTIQKWLNGISKNYPAIPKQTVDGIFGESTRSAITLFQKVFNLSQDGIVGLATWYKLSSIYVAIERLAEGK